ncbi:MAG: hypothetical protein K2M64_02220 [Clostridia bacterium]|nr:hypothetical protein [Clostridia bacterium]
MAKKSNNSSSSSGSRISLNKISFWLLVAAAIVYLVGIILSAVGLGNITSYLLAVATSMMICVVAVLAWRFVAHKPTVWIVLYFVVLLVIIAGIVLPLVL